MTALVRPARGAAPNVRQFALPPQRSGKERDLAFIAKFTVKVERKPGALFGETMNDIRSRLDHPNIQPMSFLPITQIDSGVGFEIAFCTENEAHLFQRDFR